MFCVFCANALHISVYTTECILLAARLENEQNDILKIMELAPFTMVGRVVGEKSDLHYMVLYSICGYDVRKEDRLLWIITTVSEWSTRSESNVNQLNLLIIKNILLRPGGNRQVTYPFSIRLKEFCILTLFRVKLKINIFNVRTRHPHVTLCLFVFTTIVSHCLLLEPRVFFWFSETKCCFHRPHILLFPVD